MREEEIRFALATHHIGVWFAEVLPLETRINIWDKAFLWSGNTEEAYNNYWYGIVRAWKDIHGHE